MLIIREMRLRCGGFTLIEMIVTVAILSILLAIAAPSFQTLLANMRLRSTAESLMAGLQLARTEALRRNTSVSFWMVNNLNAGCALSASSTTWVVSLDNLQGGCNAAPSLNDSPRIVQIRAGNEVVGNVTISAINAANAATSCATFTGFGAVSGGCTGVNNSTPIAAIDVTSNVANTRALRIQVAGGGSLRLCEPAINTAGDPRRCV